MKTDKEVEAEIAALEAMKPEVPKESIFGDDNHAAIDAQLTIMRARQAGQAGQPEGTEHAVAAAHDAAEWMRGEPGVMAPSEDWGVLVQPD